MILESELKNLHFNHGKINNSRPHNSHYFIITTQLYLEHKDFWFSSCLGSTFGTFFTENIIFRNVLNIRYPSHSPYFRLTLKRPLGTAIRPARRVRLHASIVIKGACVNASITITWIQSNFKTALPNQTIPPVTKAEGRKPLQHERIHAAFSLSQLSVTVSKCMSACVFVGICHLCRVHLLAFQGSKQVSSYFTWSKGWAYDSFTEVVKLESNKVSVMFISHLLFCIIRHDVQHNCWTCPYSVLLIVF